MKLGSRSGVMLRRDLSMADQVSAVVRGCHYNIRQLRAIRSSPTREALRDAAYALILSRVDYRNARYVNSPAVIIRRLQTLVNMAAHIVYGRPRFGHMMDYVRDYVYRRV